MAEITSISPELLKKCQDAFSDKYLKSDKILAIIKKVRDGTATLDDSADYSELIGSILGKVLGQNITFDVLPENTLFWNIAQDVIKPLLEQNCDLVNLMAEDCQRLVYDRAKIGIKVKAPPRNDDKIDGILQNVTRPDLSAEQLKNHLETYTENFTESVHDEFIQEQARRSNAAGLTTKVVRIATNCCKWCAAQAGIYDYEDVKETGNDVWRRHVDCKCRIIYQSEKGSQLVLNYKNPDSKSVRSGGGKYRVRGQETYDFIKRNNQRLEFIDKMVKEKGWSEKQAAIYFNKHKMWLES